MLDVLVFRLLTDRAEVIAMTIEAAQPCGYAYRETEPSPAVPERETEPARREKKGAHRCMLSTMVADPAAHPFDLVLGHVFTSVADRDPIPFLIP
jgi:hypothetical protein